MSKEAQNSASASAILNQVLGGQAAKRDVIPTYLHLGSLKCSWLSSMLSGFSLISRVEMPLCSAPRSNRWDKDSKFAVSKQRVAAPASSAVHVL